MRIIGFDGKSLTPSNNNLKTVVAAIGRFRFGNAGRESAPAESLR